MKSIIFLLAANLSCILSYAQLPPAISITPTNCTCSGSQNGQIIIDNISQGAKVKLEKMDNIVGQYVLLSDLSFYTKPYINLGGGKYMLTIEEGGISVQHATSISEPDQATFKFNPLTEQDIPQSTSAANGKVSIELPPTIRVEDIKVFYRFNDEATYQSIAATRTIPNLKVGSYDFYITTKNDCKSENQNISMPVSGLFAAKWLPVKICNAATANLEFEVSRYLVNETITASYLFQDLARGDLDLPVESAGKKRFSVPLIDNQHGAYKINIKGSAGRNSTLEFKTSRDMCDLPCKSEITFAPTLRTPRGAVKIYLENPNPNGGPYSFVLEKASAKPLFAEKTNEISFDVDDLKSGSYSLNVTDTKSEAKCQQVVTVPVPSLPDKLKLKLDFYTEMGNKVYRKKALCDCMISRRKAVDWTLTTILTIPVVISPITSAAAAAKILAWGAVGGNFFKTGFIRNEKFNSVVEYRGNLERIIKLEQQLAAQLGGPWNSATAAKAEEIIDKIKKDYEELEPIEEPSCSQARFQNILQRQFPDALEKGEKDQILERLKKAPVVTAN